MQKTYHETLAVFLLGLAEIVVIIRKVDINRDANINKLIIDLINKNSHLS